MRTCVYPRVALRARTEAWTLRQERVNNSSTSALAKMAKPLDINQSLARAISDAAWRQFRTLLEYKCDWYGLDLVVEDRWFPSSKLCSACGALAERMPLNVRSWTCRCGQIHDRDVNAARNLLAAGLAVTACGDGVRPQRESSRAGQSSAKQENPRATKGIPVLQGAEDVKSFSLEGGPPARGSRGCHR